MNKTTLNCYEEGNCPKRLKHFFYQAVNTLFSAVKLAI